METTRSSHSLPEDDALEHPGELGHPINRAPDTMPGDLLKDPLGRPGWYIDRRGVEHFIPPPPSQTLILPVVKKSK